MIEIFKDITGYEGLYQVSNLGRVKSLKYNHTSQERILKSCKLANGYLQVQLWKEGKRKIFYLHRLVANAFIPNPENKPFINHKDETRTNNCVENLEWCTAKYNTNYGTCIKRIAENVSRAMLNNPKISTKIKCLDLEKKETTYFPSIREAARQMNISQSAISRSMFKCKSPYKKRFIFQPEDK